jgi:hypothetical protein
MKMYSDVNQFWAQSGAAYTPTLVVTFGGLTAENYYYQNTEVWKHPILSKFVPPTLLRASSVRRIMAPEDEFRDDDAAAAAKQLLDRGINVNIGAHGQREGLGSHWEIWSFARGGFSPMEALSTATINPARYLKMDADLGSIEKKKLADLLILNANPLENIRNTDKISHIMANGRLYEAKSLKEVHTGEKRTQTVLLAGETRERDILESNAKLLCCRAGPDSRQRLTDVVINLLHVFHVLQHFEKLLKHGLVICGDGGGVFRHELDFFNLKLNVTQSLM